MSTILIVDDDAAMRDALSEVVRDLGDVARVASCGKAALAMLADEPIDAMLLDLRMPGIDGLEVLRRVRAFSSDLPVTVLTAHATTANTIEAMRLGAFDHLTKPIGRNDLARVLHGMLAIRASRSTDHSKKAPEGMIGASEVMRTVQKTIGMLADSDATVLVTGETGTGKELVARAMHEHGARSAEPFVGINCAAIPAELMESELFGHVRGSFTGATGDRIGAFRQAQGGTLFLDEIGDMDIAMQAKILRVLQERTVTPIGGTPAPVDVRVIAATHQDLRQQIAAGRFREDLFYRLYVVPIHLPPLRERIEDILPLAEHFLARRGDKQLAADATACLIAHSWPGNVRELRNAMERAAVLARGGVITATDLDFIVFAPKRGSDSVEWPDEDLPSATARLEEMLIRRALARSAGNRAEAARLLGIHRPLLYAKMKRYGLQVSEDRTRGVREPNAPGEAEE
jgi:DNA-binding NtrC family response regulator